MLDVKKKWQIGPFFPRYIHFFAQSCGQKKAGAKFPLTDHRINWKRGKKAEKKFCCELSEPRICSLHYQTFLCPFFAARESYGRIAAGVNFQQ